MENDFQYLRFNNLTKAFRREKSKQQREANKDTENETDSDQTLSTYVHGVMKLTKIDANLSQIHSDLQSGEKIYFTMDLSPPN